MLNLLKNGTATLVSELMTVLTIIGIAFVIMS